MKKTILFVDDIPERFERFVKFWDDNREGILHAHTVAPDYEIAFAETLDQAAILLCQNTWDEVWLDHDNMLIGKPLPNDLGFGHVDVIAVTWRPIACMLAAMKYKGRVILHSANPAGRQWMYLLLKDHGVNVVDNGFPSYIFGAD